MPEFDEKALERLSELIATRTGLNTFTAHRPQLIAALQREGITNITDYHAYLTMLNESHPIWQALLAELTVGETYFMRDSSQIEALRSHILPDVIQQQQAIGSRQLNIWSAGCATGEEAYTLAILLHEALPDIDRWHVNIIGSDISLAALDIAERGVYGAWSFRNTAPELRDRYFIPQTGDRYRIRPEIRNMVTFRHDNLVNSHQYHQNLIICRNVLIYFTRQQVQIAEQSLTTALKANGWLMLSPVESLRHERAQFTIHHIAKNIVFQKRTHAIAMPGRMQTPPQSTIERYQMIVEAMHQGKILEAEMLSAGTHTRLYVEWEILKSSIKMARGDRQTAQNMLNTIIEEHPFVADAHYLLALLQLDMDDVLAARTSLRAALYCEPRHTLARLLNGDIFMRNGDFERASHEWQIAREEAAELPADTFLSDVADVTAGQVVMLVNNRLE